MRKDINIFNNKLLNDPKDLKVLKDHKDHNNHLKDHRIHFKLLRHLNYLLNRGHLL